MIARILEDTGGELPPLVYMPGVDGTGEFLFGTATHLARRFRLVRLRYESEAEETCTAAGYGELALSVAHRIEEAALERPILLAESFGAALALRTAIDHPERVRALALVNGFAHYDQRLRVRLGAGLARFLHPRLFDLGRRFLVPRALFGPRNSPEVRRAFFALPGGRLDRGYRCRLAMIADLDLRPELGRIPHPVRLFVSDRDRIVPAARAARVLQAGLANARTEPLVNAGHVMLPFESERWVERLSDLQRSLDARP